MQEERRLWEMSPTVWQSEATSLEVGTLTAVA